MLKRIVSPYLLLAALFFLLGMGFGESDGPTRIPEPSADFKVRLIDQEGTRVDLTNFSINGQVFLMGNLGQGQAAVAMDKVKVVEITKQGDKLKALLTLQNGDPVELEIKGSLTATGKTSFGNFRIPLKEVTRIEVLGRIMPGTEPAAGPKK